jgi:hypothetical protein
MGENMDIRRNTAETNMGATKVMLSVHALDIHIQAWREFCIRSTQLLRDSDFTQQQYPHPKKEWRHHSCGQQLDKEPVEGCEKV